MKRLSYFIDTLILLFRLIFVDSKNVYFYPLVNSTNTQKSSPITIYFCLILQKKSSTIRSDITIDLVANFLEMKHFEALSDINNYIKNYITKNMTPLKTRKIGLKNV